VNVGDRLPDLDLETADGKPVGLRSPRRGAPVLLVPPPSALAAEAYVLTFLTDSASLDVWNGRPLVVVGSLEQADQLAGEVAAPRDRLVVDADGRLRRSLGFEGSRWGLVIADRWGVVYQVSEADHAEELPDIGEIREWTKFLATQCPECGVIDEPVPSG
jgi:hypothetical protein